MLTYLLAVLAACANATSSVLQRKAGQQAPRRQNLSPKLIWSLAHQPVWFGGILPVFAGFLLQASALGNGQLSVVEPILVLELPITLVLASAGLRIAAAPPGVGLDGGDDRGPGRAAVLPVPVPGPTRQRPLVRLGHRHRHQPGVRRRLGGLGAPWPCGLRAPQRAEQRAAGGRARGRGRSHVRADRGRR